MTEENINKMQEIAYNDALGDGKYESNSFRSFLFKLRDEVAPDRDKLLSEALAQFDKDIQNYAFKKGENPETLLEYILKAEGKFDSGNGSYSGSRHHNGHICMDIFDENGDRVGGYSSNSGFHKFSTPKENCVGIFFSKLYHDTYLEYSKQTESKRNVSGGLSMVRKPQNYTKGSLTTRTLPKTKRHTDISISEFPIAKETEYRTARRTLLNFTTVRQPAGMTK